jgi:hypothetical protein
MVWSGLIWLRYWQLRRAVAKELMRFWVPFEWRWIFRDARVLVMYRGFFSKEQIHISTSPAYLDTWMNDRIFTQYFLFGYWMSGTGKEMAVSNMLKIKLHLNYTYWTVRGSNPGGGEIFRTRPDRPWGPPSLLYNGYKVFPGGKAAGAWCWSPTPF